MKHFLSSLGSSCEKYSLEAEEQREKLRAIDEKYRKLDTNAKKTLIESPKKSRNVSGSPSRSVSNVNSRAVTPSKKKKKEPELVIKPAPFPVKNYVLPAQQISGPQRYYRSAAKMQKEKEKYEEYLEYERYPNAFEHPPEREENPFPPIYTAPLSPKKPPSQDVMDIYFESP